MDWIGELMRRLRFRLRGARFDQDLAEEMQLHLELRAAEQGEGEDGRAAEAAARRRFGNLTQLRERSREAWGWTWIDTLLRDLRYGVRTLAANPGFAATAVVSLALGIGANTAIFSIVHAVLLRELPVEDPQRLVQLREGTDVTKGDGELTNPIWEQVRDHPGAFQGMLAYSPTRFDLSDGGESHYAEGLWVSGDYFRVLGVPAWQGRVFSPADDRHGGGEAGPVAVISYRFWKRNFPGGANAIGKKVRLNRHLFEIVGVTPPWFTGLEVDQGFDVAVPIGCTPLLHASDFSMLEQRMIWWLRVLGRLAPGESLKQAQDRVRSMAPEILRATLPPRNQKEYLKNTFSLRPVATGFSRVGEQYRTALFTLMATVGVVLLIACANIANLLLARSAARQREFSVRMAIGASRARVIRQLMTESLLLATLGAAGGFLMAMWGSRMLVGLLSAAGRPLEIDVAPDRAILAFTAAAALLTALLFGLAPAFRATRSGLGHGLKEQAAGGGRRYAGRVLVTAQMALSLVLLVGAGLFLSTMRNLLTLDPGFNRHQVLLVTADTSQSSVPKQGRIRVQREILERLRALPGVGSAATAMIEPISGTGWAQLVNPEGYESKGPRDTLVFLNRVSPDYFRTMETVFLMGRDFQERDDANAPKVMVIAESAARQFFGQQNPIGKRIGLDRFGLQGGKDEYTVIGVVKDAKYLQIGEVTRRLAYVAAAQDPEPMPQTCYLVRSNGPVEMVIPGVRSTIGELNRSISLRFTNFETQVNDSLLQPRVVAFLSAIFGALALVLAMVGLYGTTAYGVAQRRGEIGIRMALGAEPRSVVWLILREVTGMVAVGVLLGAGVALAAGRLVGSLLFGVRANDPGKLMAAALVLAGAAAMAAYFPARRAARLDPMTALREE